MASSPTFNPFETARSLFLARLYGVELGFRDFTAIAMMGVFLSFTVPGIPGGSIIIMVPALLTAGVPIEGIGLLLAIDTVPDMFRTTTNVTAHMGLAAILGRTTVTPPSEVPVSGIGVENGSPTPG